MNNIKKKDDIFDKIMKWRIMNPFQPFYIKNKELILYLFFGGLTVIISIVSYYIFSEHIGLNKLFANIISWILAVSFAFITNYIWVFETHVSSLKQCIYQMLKFFMGRLLTLVVEEVILLFFVIFLKLASMPIKIIAQIVVIMLNYIISKRIVFK